MISSALLLGAVSCVLGQAPAQFPAGIDPRLCPNFPQCDNALLAAFAKNPLPGFEKFAGGGGRGAGVGSGKPVPYKIDHFLLTPPGYPIGLSRDQCPNYPFCK
uniref:Cuticle protein 1 n=1 Tax=Lygus hesperus TaxID=30085 RepID=A0A146M524_LYGHE